jgi:1-deoxy-D-xylulose-5-phosphate synthase
LHAGEDILILAIGSMVAPALEARRLLLSQGISGCVINARYVKPLDKELIIKWGKKCKRILTVEEHLLAGGFGSAILEMLEEELGKEFSKLFVKRMGLENPFTGQGDRDILLSSFNLTGEGIAGVAVKMCYDREKMRKAR